MKIEEVKKLSPLERFLYWVRERRQILLKRRAGKQRPWTDDEVLQSYYFTNVCREDDRVTIWFRENIREPLRDDPAVVFATVAFRWFNWPDTGQILLNHPSTSKFGSFTEWDCVEVVNLLSRRGKVFTGAFNISNSGSTKPKINRVCEDYIQPVWENRECLITNMRNACNMKQAFDHLRCLPGLGGSGFMAGQVICDLAYTHVLENVPDWWTWCSWGPGSKRGMNRVFGKPVDYAMPRREWDSHLNDLQILIRQKLGLKLHARDVQNCLCEMSKYESALWQDGHLKRRYQGA